jgi:hypothetical protein
MMTFYTGWQWLLIDAANAYGHDKLLFEERIKWAETMLAQGPGYLEAKAALADTKPLYLKAVQAIRRAQRGEPIGHMVGVDASCSGIQIMSAMAGCVSGARETGLIDPDVRADAYTRTTYVMNQVLKDEGISVDVSRSDAKQALMTSFYGSKAVPEALFGEGTQQLSAFYQAAMQVAPGAWELLQDLKASWQPYALQHAWKLPDGYDALVKVMKKEETRIEVDELDHATFSYEYKINEGTAKGVANAANVTHSMDAYVLREMHRRCNYDTDAVTQAMRAIEIELGARADGYDQAYADIPTKIEYYVDQYRRSTLASAVFLPWLSLATTKFLDLEHLEALLTICKEMLKHKSFPLVTVHDEFKAHPNNVNWVRWHYKEILAEIADSNVLDDLLSQIHGVPGNFNKLSFNLGDQIRKSNYALC